jgi:hypothetical protein
MRILSKNCYNRIAVRITTLSILIACGTWGYGQCADKTAALEKQLQVDTSSIDTSNLKVSTHTTILPILFYEPETKLGGGATCAFYRR